MQAPPPKPPPDEIITAGPMTPAMELARAAIDTEMTVHDLEQRAIQARLGPAKINESLALVRRDPVTGKDVILEHPQGVRAAAANILEAVGRDRFISALEHSTDPRATNLCSVMLDPFYAAESFAKQCQRAGLDPLRALQFFKDFTVAQGIASAASHVPVLLQDLARDAASQDFPCAFCGGAGNVPTRMGTDIPCPECHSTGVQHVPGDKDARQLYFEIMGVRKSGSGVAVNIAQQFNTAASSMPTMEKFIDITDDL
jgi:hypothetical protein